VTRRQLLATGAALLVAPMVVGPRRALAKADDGTAIVQRYATGADDPWVVSHGLRAMGRDFTLKDGRRAVDYLLESVLASFSVNGRIVLGYPPDVEVHPNMFLKTILEAGVPLDYAFTHEGRRRTLNDVVEGARTLLRPKLVISDPNALPWTIIALTRTTPPLRRPWSNAWGEPVDLDELVESALRLLEQASQPLARDMQEGRPETGKAPVHEFTCGGTHMIYALLTAVHAGYTGRDRAARVQRQADLLVWRLGGDIDLIDRFYREVSGDPKAPWYELDSRLKLLGHAEECLAFAATHKVVKFTPAQRTQRQAAVVKLERMLADLGTRNLADARAIDRELYRQLIGDTCHARHGLSFA
jgi:hypothetical protein